jgi:hypothetical protein
MNLALICSSAHRRRRIPLTIWHILRHNEAVCINLRWLLRGRLGTSVVVHGIGHRHDTSALQDLWAAVMEKDEADPCCTPDPTGPDDRTSQHHATRMGRIFEWVFDIPLGDNQDNINWDRYHPDILIATEGKACQGDIIRQLCDCTIHIVEAKYCCDTEKNKQALKAVQQHEALREALLQVGYKPEQVHMHVITLGATDTIYKARMPRS